MDGDVQDPLLGRTLSQDYRLVELLAQGRVSRIYLAEHTRLPQRFAAKVLRSEFSFDATARERFKREAELVSGLGSPNLVQMLDFNEVDGQLYQVMELLTGETLAQRLQAKGKLPLPQVERVVEQLVAALSTVHQAGVVHRNLRPAAVFLHQAPEGGEVVKLLGFGLSKVPSAPSLTGEDVLGTPLYMSPEQARASSAVDARADVYSLAAIIFEMLSGEPPFEGGTAAQVLQRIVQEPPRLIRKRMPQFSPAFDGVLQMAMAKEPNRRPKSVEEFWMALTDALETTAPGS
jgi:serine/threonine-protein kinase